MTMVFVLGRKGHIYFFLVLHILICEVVYNVNGGRLPVEEDFIRKDLGETGKYLFRSEQYRVLYCYYCPQIAFKSDSTLIEYTEGKCHQKNLQLEADEKKNHLYPYCRKGKKIACPPLTDLEHGEWDCGDEDPSEVRVYKSCQPGCDADYHLSHNASESYRCGETRLWDRNITAVRCIKDDPKITKGTSKTVSQNGVEIVKNDSLNITGNNRESDMTTPYTQGDQIIKQTSRAAFMNDDPRNFSALPDISTLSNHDKVRPKNNTTVKVYVTRNVSVNSTVDENERTKHPGIGSAENGVNIWLTIVIPVAAFIIAIVVIVLCCLKHRNRKMKRKKISSASDDGMQLKSLIPDPGQESYISQKPITESSNRDSNSSVSQATDSSGYLSSVTTVLTDPKDKPEDGTVSRNSEKEKVAPVKSGRVTSNQHSVEDADSMNEFDKLLPSGGPISGLSESSKEQESKTLKERPLVGPGQSLQQVKTVTGQDHTEKDSMKEFDKLLQSGGPISGLLESSKEQESKTVKERPPVDPRQSLQQAKTVQGQDHKEPGSPTSEEDYVKIYPTRSQNKTVMGTTKFMVVSGSNVYITTRCQMVEGDAFEISKDKGNYRGKAYSPSFSFIHQICSVEEMDTGLYFWNVKMSLSKNGNSGRFILEVVSSESPVPAELTPVTGKEYSSLCKATVAEVLDSCSKDTVQNMYYTLDANGKWFGLAEALLPSVDPALFKSIRWHKRGNPEDGPTEYIFAEFFRARNTKFGEIVKYFAESGLNNMKVILFIRLFEAHYKKCKYCDEIAKKT